MHPHTWRSIARATHSYQSVPSNFSYGLGTPMCTDNLLWTFSWQYTNFLGRSPKQKSIPLSSQELFGAGVYSFFFFFFHRTQTQDWRLHPTRASTKPPESIPALKILEKTNNGDFSTQGNRFRLITGCQLTLSTPPCQRIQKAWEYQNGISGGGREELKNSQNQV